MGPELIAILLATAGLVAHVGSVVIVAGRANGRERAPPDGYRPKVSLVPECHPAPAGGSRATDSQARQPYESRALWRSWGSG